MSSNITSRQSLNETIRIHIAGFTQELVIIHCTCVILFSTGKTSPLAKARGLFFKALMLVGDAMVVVDGRHSPMLAGISEAFLFSKLVTTSGNEETGTIPSQLFVAPLIANSESCSLAVSRSGDSTEVQFRTLHAFSSIVCKYLPCASIRSWTWRCT